MDAAFLFGEPVGIAALPPNSPQAAPATAASATPARGAPPPAAVAEVTVQSPAAQAALVLALVRQLAAAQQAGLATLMADLTQASLPPAVKSAANTLADLHLPTTVPPNPDAVKTAFLRSGLFREAAQGTDLRTALATLQSALEGWDEAASREPASEPATSAAKPQQDASAPKADTTIKAAAPKADTATADVAKAVVTKVEERAPQTRVETSPQPQRETPAPQAATPSRAPAAQKSTAQTNETTAAPPPDARPAAPVAQKEAATSTSSAAQSIEAPAARATASNKIVTENARIVSPNAQQPIVPRPAAVPADTTQAAPPPREPVAAVSTPRASTPPAPASDAAPRQQQTSSTTAVPARQPATLNAPPPTAAPSAIASPALPGVLARADVLSALLFGFAAPDDAPEYPAPAAPSDAGQATSQQAAARAAPPPPFRGGPLTAQPAAAASLPDDSDPATIAKSLLSAVTAASARQTLLQLASVPDAPRAPNTHWMFEIPLMTPQGPAVAHFAIERDGSQETAEAPSPIWRVQFAVDVEPLGPVHASLAMSGDRTWIRLGAERPESLELIRAGVDRLSEALGQEELTAEIAFQQGPAPERQPRHAAFLDGAS